MNNSRTDANHKNKRNFSVTGRKKKQKPVGLGGYRARHFYFLKKLGCR
jgi:hypothetical protein